MTRLPLALAFIVAGLVSACQSPPPPAASSSAEGALKTAATSSQPAAVSAAAVAAKPEVWNQLLDGAKREGALTVYGAGPDNRTGAEAFGKEFPDVKVAGVYAPNSTLISRIGSERTAGKFIPDILFGVGSAAVVPFKSQGGLAPMQPALVLPEVLDMTAWQENRLWWVDSAQPYTTLAFVGRVQEIVSYNTNLVDPKDIKSYWDLLDPKWKGKIVVADVREPGPGQTFAAYVYKHPIWANAIWRPCSRT